ncbi:hypothetical protein SteCoe_27377 [Stentor coeruleus]|uniref:Uncharacterized protein n=1 Tax=Stentor coeruleus TaxID=5963 RepID=A0A1R2BAM8_9CILI|nr:hypothetical protein SteCoe_27377 [Stentor coeruleus]
MINSIGSLFQTCNSCEINDDYYFELDKRIKLIEAIKENIYKQAKSIKILIEKLSKEAIRRLEQYIKYYNDLKKTPVSESKKINLLKFRLVAASNLCINTSGIKGYFDQDFISEKNILKNNNDYLNHMSPQELKLELENKYGFQSTGHTGYITSLVIFSDNDRFITCSQDKTIRLWSLKSKSQIHVFLGHTSVIWNVSLNFNNQLLVSSSGDSTVKIWSIEEKRLLFTKIGHMNFVTVALLTKDNKIISGSGDCTVRIWNLYSDKEIGQFEFEADISSLALTNDEEKVVVGCSNSIITMLNLKKFNKELEIKGPSMRVSSVCLFNDSSMIVTGGSDNLVNIYSVSESVLKNSISLSSKVYCVSLSSDQKYILAGNGSGTLDVISLVNYKIEYSLSGHTKEVRGAEMSSDGSFIITGSIDNSFIIWDTKTRTKKNILMHQHEPLNFLGATPDYKYVFIGSGNGLVKLYDLKNKVCIENYAGFQGALQIKFSNNRKYMIFSDNEFRFKVCFTTEKVKMLFASYAKGIIS